MSCPFCKIMEGTGPANFLVDDRPHAALIVPRHQVTQGHCLAIPGVHVEDFAEDPDVTAELVRFASYWARELGGDGQAWNLITSKGRDATQSVFHLHVHLVPRHRDDGLALPWTGRFGGRVSVPQ